MAFCDHVLTRDIQGYNCDAPALKGAQSMGYLYNRSDIASVVTHTHFCVDLILKTGAQAYRVYQYGKTPFNGTQQEMTEGVYANTITNTVQLVVLKQDENWAEQLYALINGEFVCAIRINGGKPSDFSNSHDWVVLGSEAGLHCTGAVRELYNDDTLAGWLLTFTEEGASRVWYSQDPENGDEVSPREPVTP